MARSLNVAERNYAATKRELLAIVFALQKFHYDLWGSRFTLYTDHRALTFLHTQKQLNAMMVGWLDILLEFSFDIIHRPGILNVLPDHLSRLFPTSFQNPEGQSVQLNLPRPTKHRILT